MSTFKYILFDWDGCLARTLDIWLDTYKYLCKKYHVDISELSDLEIVEKSFGTWSKGLADLGIKDFERAYQEALKIVDDKIKRVSLYPNVRETLNDLADKSKKLALHTSSFRNLLYPAISNKGVEKYFKIILTKDDVEKGKPNPEVILKELSFFDADPEEAVVIGDSNYDIKAGKAAGVKTVLYYPPENHKFYRKEFLTKEGPDYLITDLMQLPKIVE